MRNGLLFKLPGLRVCKKTFEQIIDPRASSNGTIASPVKSFEDRWKHGKRPFASVSGTEDGDKSKKLKKNK